MGPRGGELRGAQARSVPQRGPGAASQRGLVLPHEGAGHLPLLEAWRRRAAPELVVRQPREPRLLHAAARGCWRPWLAARRRAGPLPSARAPQG
ncbi:unnamed protein product, partial [Prorocentrum cordatum]